jgi:flagellar export protein FliJ
MKQFRFSLQSILKLYQDREQDAERQYAATLRSLEVARQRAEQAQAELHLCWQGVINASSGGCQAWRLEQVRLYAQGLKEHLDQLELQRRAAAATVQTALRSLLAARQKRETLQKLRDRRHLEYSAAGVRADQKQTDELVSATFGQASFLDTSTSQFS